MPVTFKFDFDKAFAAIVYLASKSDSVPEFDKLKAGKLLFFSDKYHLVRYARPILGGSYRAIKFGPVPQDALDYIHAVIDPARASWVDAGKLKKLSDALVVDHGHQYPRLSAKEPINFSEYLSKSDLEALDHVIEKYGKKSATELSALTHAMPAYLNAWETRGDQNKVDMKYEDFFEADPDAIEGALDEMLEDDELRRAFPGTEF